ncbi:MULTISPECIES: DotG/IcmE/VirB10 family protein [Cysteiniphilum]|uniref:Uncharacterized protein n=1 Tax=Cysteiniphilum litorale TaxID=2056700 RepID=A0A8J3E866_9GAMM|nr:MULTISPECIES: DotG/IcmE/VirB10 family protein [Cysteiniphilum]GGF92582.1 hypothetical protein GCM10010995_07170 [Cysteiniphilum litorale]
MNMKEEKVHKVRNTKLLISIAVGVVIVSLAGYKLFLSASESSSSVGVSINTSFDSGSNRSDLVNSSLIRQKHEAYEEAKEKQARDDNTSFISTVGSINPIKQSQPLTKPKQDYDYQSALKARQKKEDNTDSVASKTKTQSNDIQISDAFEKAIKAYGLDKLELSTHTANASGYKTVTPPEYTGRLLTQAVTSMTQSILGQIDAGTTLYGVIINQINSDFETPVIAEIQMGKYRGAKVFGKFTVRDKWIDGISIEFNKMIWKGITFTIHAIAVNADYLPNLYDDIDHHYLQRFSGLIAGATFGAIQGAAQPYQGKNTPTVIVGSSGSQTQIYTPPDAKQIAFSAAGGAATSIAGQLQPVFTSLWDRPTTVTVNRGHGIGILFTETSEIKVKGE